MRLRLLWGWLMEAPLLLQWLPTWVTAQPWSLGQWGSPHAPPPSLAEGLMLAHPGRSALLSLGWDGWEGTCSCEDGRLSFPLSLSIELKTWTPFRLAQIVFFISHIQGWGRKVCSKETRDVNKCTLNLGKPYEIWLALSYFCLRLGSQGRPGLEEGLFLLSLVYQPSCSSAAVAIPADSPKMQDVLGPVPSAPILHWLAKDLMALPREFRFLLLTCTGSSSQDGPGGDRQAGQLGGRVQRTALDVASAALCAEWLVFALWRSAGALESLCKQDILPAH